MSFTRDDYRRMFLFAAKVYDRQHNHKNDLSIMAVELMDKCEVVIGQQQYRPDRKEK